MVLNVVVRENNNIFSSTELIFRKLNITVRENSNIFIIMSIINSLQTIFISIFSVIARESSGTYFKETNQHNQYERNL